MDLKEKENKAKSSTFFLKLNRVLKSLNSEILENRSEEIANKFALYMFEKDIEFGYLEDVENSQELQEITKQIFSRTLDLEKNIYSKDYLILDKAYFHNSYGLKPSTCLYDFLQSNFENLFFECSGDTLKELLCLINSLPYGKDIIENNFEYILNTVADKQKDDVIELVDTLDTLYSSNYLNFIEIFEKNKDVLVSPKYDSIKMVLYSLISGRSEQIDNLINLEYANKKEDIINLSLHTNGFCKIDESISQNYLNTITLLIEDLQKHQGLKYSDMRYLSSGFYSTIFEIGDYVLKIRRKRGKYDLLDNSHLLKPMFRYEFKSSNSNNLLTMEILQKVKTLDQNSPEITFKLYEMYKSLIKQNIVWADITPQNLGLIPYTTTKDNTNPSSVSNIEAFNSKSLNTLGLHEVSNPLFKIHENKYKNDDEILMTVDGELYQLVILDNDFLFSMSNNLSYPITGINPTLLKRELKDKVEKGETLSVTEKRFLNLLKDFQFYSKEKCK